MFHQIHQNSNMITRYRNTLATNIILKPLSRRLHYVQGQEPEPKIREYFYYIDHQGMVCNLRSKLLLFKIRT